MKLSDYLVDFLASRGVTDVFGYPGGMVTHLMESFSARHSQIRAHVNYYEQAAAFAACGYAQAAGIPGVAYATSGSGATNLITGIANAWFDSVPVLFLTGQVSSYEAKGGLAVRQRGFQETDILSMVRGITKYVSYVGRKEDIRYELEKAWHYAMEGRRGSVLLDIPMDIQRGDVEVERLRGFVAEKSQKAALLDASLQQIHSALHQAVKPVLLIGAGVKSAQAQEAVLELTRCWNIPIVSSMAVCDVIGRSHPCYFGFIGAYGDRAANWIVAKSDLILSLGSRLDVRQVGANRTYFGGQAKLIRIDIDEGELAHRVKEDEQDILCDLRDFLEAEKQRGYAPPCVEEWLALCHEIQEKLAGCDKLEPNEKVRLFSLQIPKDVRITADVGQNQVWVAQSFVFVKGQSAFFPAGMGLWGIRFWLQSAYIMPAENRSYLSMGMAASR